MAKLTTSPAQTFTPIGLGVINSNFDRVEVAMEKTLSRDGTSPNQMEADLDMNNNDLINADEVSGEVGRFDRIIVGELTYGELIPSISDLTTVTVEMFGAGLSGLQEALDYAAPRGYRVDLGWGKTYSGTTLDIPDNARIIGDASLVLTSTAPNGTATGSTTVSIGDNVNAVSLRFSGPGGDASIISNYFILMGNNPDIHYLEVIGSSQRQRVGIRWDADTIVGKLGKVVVRNMDRPLSVNNTTGAATRANTQIVIGDIDFESYVTGFRPSYLNYRVTGHVSIRGRSPNATKIPGANAILNQACGRHIFDNPIWLDGSAEHLWRIGNPEGETGDDADDVFVSIPWIFASNSGGCAFKCTQKTVTFSRIHVGGITMTNVGCETYGHGEEAVRLAKMDNIYIGPIYSFKTDGNFLEGYVHPVNGGDPVDLPNVFPRAAVQMQDCSNFRIGPIYGTYRAQFVDFYGASDTGDTGGGPVENGEILIGDAICEGGSAIRFYSSPASLPSQMTVGDVRIKFDGARGWTDNLYSFGRDNPPGTDPYVEITDKIEIFGYISGDVGPRNESDEVGIGHELIEVNLDWKGKRRQGTAQALGRTAARVNRIEEIVAETTSVFDPGDVAPVGRVLNQSRLTAGLGNYGAALLEATELGSLDRAIAVVPVQTGNLSQHVSLDFFAGTSGASTSAVNHVLRLHHLGHLHAPRLPTYADNAAALSGGLIVHDIYKTATGELRIVV